MAFTLLLALPPQPVWATTLLGRLLPSTRTVGGAVIIGRAQCADGLWLLNEARQLIRVVPAAASSQGIPTIELRAVTGLTKDDRPWGLACLAGRTLWTLANPRTLGRIAQDGVLVERLALTVPWIALFGIGDRLLFEPVPPLIASSVLAVAFPRRADASRPWPGLITQATNARADLLARNLVACGLASGSALPCWFAGGTSVILSDGSRANRFSFPFIQAEDVDKVAPLRDVAFVDGDRVWLLPTSSRLDRGQHAGDRILLATRSGREIARLMLDSPARLMVAASDTRCLVLTVQGELFEVTVR